MDTRFRFRDVLFQVTHWSVHFFELVVSIWVKHWFFLRLYSYMVTEKHWLDNLYVNLIQPPSIPRSTSSRKGWGNMSTNKKSWSSLPQKVPNTIMSGEMLSPTNFWYQIPKLFDMNEAWRNILPTSSSVAKLFRVHPSLTRSMAELLFFGGGGWADIFLWVDPLLFFFLYFFSIFFFKNSKTSIYSTTLTT